MYGYSLHSSLLWSIPQVLFTASTPSLSKLAFTSVVHHVFRPSTPCNSSCHDDDGFSVGWSPKSLSLSADTAYGQRRWWHEKYHLKRSNKVTGVDLVSDKSWKPLSHKWFQHFQHRKPISAQHRLWGEHFPLLSIINNKSTQSFSS